MCKGWGDEERNVRCALGAKAADRREVPSGCMRKRASKKACQG